MTIVAIFVSASEQPVIDPLLLARTDVKKELKLTDQQKDRVQEIGRRLTTPSALEPLTEEARGEYVQEVHHVLSEAQVKRLYQLSLWLESYSILARPDVAAKMDLPEAKRQEINRFIERVKKAEAEILRQARSGEINKAEGVRRSAAVQSKLDADVEALLSEEEKAKFNQLRGDRFPR